MGGIRFEVIFFLRGAPRGVPRGGSPGGFRGAVRASHLAKKSKDKTPGVFFHAAFDFDAPGPRNTVQKSKLRKRQIYKKSNFSNFDQIMI